MTSLPLITNTPTETVIFLACVFLAGIIRGCIGFGFSALLVVSVSLFVNPLLVVPLLILLEIAASIHMLFGIWKDTLWRFLVFMSLGSLIGIPIGLAILSLSPQATLELIVSGIIFVMTAILLAGFTYKGSLNKPILMTMGIIAGVFNGVAAAGGLVVATFLASAAFPVKNIRATMVVFIFIMEAIFIASSILTDVYNEKVFNSFFLAFLPMFLGVILGMKLFKYLDERKLRVLILFVLSLLSVIGLIKSL